MPHSFLRKLRHGANLAESDARELVASAGPVRTVRAGEDIMREGEESHGLPLILEGWAVRSRFLSNGKRQCISLLIPGDLAEPFGVLPRFLDHSVSAVTPVKFAPVSVTALRGAARASHSIEEALWWDLLMSIAIEREHIVSLGRRAAVERVGHLLCELHIRLTLVGQADDKGFDLPITQADLGDLLGLSTVHINRSLQELRRRNLISWRARRLTLHDLKELRDLSLFDENYLHVAVHPVGKIGG
ncbi:CRP-like cAMP-binding protein [Bradyrhizobium sp. USDA 372]